MISLANLVHSIRWHPLEQVSHHPPALSTYAEGAGWTLYQEFTMSSKFRGQYLSITPSGTCISRQRSPHEQHKDDCFLSLTNFRLLPFDIQKYGKSFHMEKGHDSSQ